MAYFLLFLFGLAVGSFANVLALRYDGEHFLFDPKVIGGRSRCPHCGKILRWFELIPLVSFAVQRGRCRHCRAGIGIQYPIVELLSGLIFVAVPSRLTVFFGPGAVPAEAFYILSGLWIIAFEILLLIAHIDLRLQIVPDELTVLLAVLAIFETIFAAAYLGSDRAPFFGSAAYLGSGGASASPAAASFFFGPYAALFGLYGNIWFGHAIGAAVGAGFFGFLALVTRGRGMGMGDVKLGLPLGFLFGWPDILPLYGSAFVIGAVVGVFLIIQKRKTAKSAVPFVPFLAVGAAFVFFVGLSATQWYFSLLGI